MNLSAFYALSGVALFGIGFYGLVLHVHLLRKLIAMNIMGSGTFLVLVAFAHRTPGAAPPDPVPHAMVLTGIVVAISATALALALLGRLHAETGQTSLDDVPTDTPTELK